MVRLKHSRRKVGGFSPDKRPVAQRAMSELKLLTIKTTRARYD